VNPRTACFARKVRCLSCSLELLLCRHCMV
jgi:hypothetical protein